ncbi:hypothetical protein BGZ59_002422 [Podila verticillata]|nr:hypothetical protein BGZ59_002422 [Podila verticillata]
MDPKDGEVEKDLQRFQSQDEAPLQSLRGRYDSELEEYYLHLYSLLVKIRQAFKTCEDLTTTIEDLDEEDRLLVMTFYINMESRYSRIQEDISRILEEAGAVEAIRIEMAEIRQGLSKLRGKALKAEFESLIQSERGVSSDTAFDYSLPYLFLLLPSDIATWDPNNPHNHTLRLHFICNQFEGDFTEGSSEGADHLLLHPGYDIRDYSGFLKHFGLVALYLLKGYQGTFEKDSKEGEAGDSRKLLRMAEGSKFSAVELGVLVDMAIESLQRSVTPQMKMDFNPDLTRRLPFYLIDDSGTMDIPLYPITHYSDLIWATEAELQEIVVGANAVHVVHLRLDGKGFKDHPMYTTERGSVFIHNIITANERNLDSVTFSNIVNLHRAPASVEYITFITNRRIVTTGLPAMSSVEWDGFKRFVFNFHKAIGERQTNSGEENRADVISGDEPNDNNPGTVHRRNTEELRRLVEEHRYVLSLTYLTENHLAATFDMPNGVFLGLVKARFPVDLNEQFLYTGSLQHFLLEVDSTNTNYLLILGKVLKHNPDLLEVMIGTKESILLSQIVFCCSCISGRVNPLHVSFYDECVGAQERVVAKLILSPVTQAAIEDSANHSRCEFSFSSIDIEVVEWVMDYGFEALSDDEAAALDTITLQFPDTLIYFNLDIRDLTKAGIESIRRVLSRSSIQFLRINCGLFDVDLKPDLVHAIAHLQRFSLLSLILRGEAVITWLELLAEATTHFTSHGQTRGSLASPEYQLVQFEVINTAPDLHLLSTRAMETIFHIYCSFSLVKFDLMNVRLLNTQRRDLLLANMDLAISQS